MKALIITKPTNLEQHGEVVRAQISRNLIEPHHLEELEEAHNEHYSCLETIRATLSARGIPAKEISRGNRQVNGQEFEFIISVGGDGTLLSASHRILDDTPVIGIRSSRSSVGYLCAGNASQFAEILDRHLANKLSFAQCARIKASIYYAEEDQHRQTVPILNDFLFANHNPSATTRYRIILGDLKEAHKSSGVWIATATGSTAGIKAAGGEVMPREESRFQYQVRELYRTDSESFTLTHGFFDPDIQNFCLENLNEAAVLALDGQRGVIPLKFGDRVSFVRAPSIRIATGI